MTILLVDDNVAMIRALSRAFHGNENIYLLACTSVEEVVDAVEEHDPDILLLDHSLSGEEGNEGFEVVRRLNGKNVKIVSTTANSAHAKWYMGRGIEHVKKLELSSYIRNFLTN